MSHGVDAKRRAAERRWRDRARRRSESPRLARSARRRPIAEAANGGARRSDGLRRFDELSAQVPRISSPRGGASRGGRRKPGRRRALSRASARVRQIRVNGRIAVPKTVRPAARVRRCRLPGGRRPPASRGVAAGHGRPPRKTTCDGRAAMARLDAPFAASSRGVTRRRSTARALCVDRGVATRNSTGVAQAGLDPERRVPSRATTPASDSARRSASSTVANR